MPLNTLNELLKEEVKDISLDELHDLSVHFNEETKYLPREYKKDYTESVIKVIVSRFATLKSSRVKYEGKLSEKDAENIIAIYTTYLRKRPIHLPGTVFPGLVTIYSDGKDYYCPVKKFHVDNPNAICRYCISKTTD